MSSRTMQLRTIIEQPTQHEEGLSFDERLEIGRQFLFDFDYPFFDEEYRPQFEKNFIRKFYMREIGFEVEELFKLQLQTWLDINMPYFNQLFESELLEFDPLINSHMKTAHEQLTDKERKDKRRMNQFSETDGHNESTTRQDTDSETHSDEEGFHRKVEQDTPDGRLQITAEDGKGAIEYASNLTENRNTGSTDSTGKSHTDVDSKDKTHVTSGGTQRDDFDSRNKEMEHFMQRRYGKIGVVSYSKLIMEFRQSFIRIENMIHDEMQELFSLVYS